MVLRDWGETNRTSEECGRLGRSTLRLRVIGLLTIWQIADDANHCSAAVATRYTMICVAVIGEFSSLFPVSSVIRSSVPVKSSLSVFFFVFSNCRSREFSGIHCLWNSQREFPRILKISHFSFFLEKLYCLSCVVNFMLMTQILQLRVVWFDITVILYKVTKTAAASDRIPHWAYRECATELLHVLYMSY